jgi:hypothetical protein
MRQIGANVLKKLMLTKPVTIVKLTSDNVLKELNRAFNHLRKCKISSWAMEGGSI